MRFAVVFVLIIILLPQSEVNAQNSENSEEEIWFIWIDTYAQIDGQNTRIVSSEPFKITCCVKSGKYRRFNKKAARWIRNNIDENFKGDQVFKNLEDRDLAVELIEKAINTDSSAPVKIIEYKDRCK